MPAGPLLEMDDISLRVEPGDLAVLSGTPISWVGIDTHDPKLRGDDIAGWSDDVRLRAGLFLTTGHPSPVPGVRTSDLIHRMFITDHRGQSASGRHALATDWCDRLGLDPEVMGRNLDDDFTPSEGTGVELLHLALLRPEVAVIDLAATAQASERRTTLVNGLRQIRTDQPALAVVVVTDDDDLIAGLTPDHVTTHASTDTDIGRPHRDETLQ